MTQHRFFVDKLMNQSPVVTLSGPQAKKVIRVLRKGAGDRLVLFDGSGIEAVGEITSLSGDQVDCLVVSRSYPRREPAVEVVVGLALIRNNRFESAVEKLTEIGVAKIVPLIADRNVVLINDPGRWNTRKKRLRSIAIQAAEQSERITVPEIAEPTPLQTFLQAPDSVVLVERSTAPLIDSIEMGHQMSIAVGPEGGWTDTETAMIRQSGAQQASLGGLVLRSETAAIVAAAAICLRIATTRE